MDLKKHQIIEIMTTVAAWEAIAEWEAICENSQRNQRSDSVFLYTQGTMGGVERKVRRDFIPRPSSLVQH